MGLITLSKWVRVYREQGEAGLQSQPGRRGSRRPKVAAAIKTKVVELKRRHPALGIQKISQFLRRVMFLPFLFQVGERRAQKYLVSLFHHDVVWLTSGGSAAKARGKAAGLTE